MLNVRLRNEGFISGTALCQFPHFQPMLGYAVTGRVRTSSAPMTGRCYYDRIDWWNYVASQPAPRVMVLQDCDHKPGIGALVGEIHAAIGTALGCVGFVTNGAVRDLPAVEAQGFHLFAGNVAVSHAYAHIVEMAEPVELGGLKILPGDLIHGDRHGVHTFPLSIASEIPAAAETLLRKEQELIDFCRSSRFSLAGLSDLLRKTSAIYPTVKER
jgi:regulator of RNase E activity RraA